MTVFQLGMEYASPARGAKAASRPMVWVLKRAPRVTDRFFVTVQRSSAYSENSVSDPCNAPDPLNVICSTGMHSFAWSPASVQPSGRRLRGWGDTRLPGNVL